MQKTILSNLTPILLLAPLFGCSIENNTKETPALFNSRREAEKAAKEFNCKGAHKMGDKWMPCKKHSDHKGH